MSRIRLAALAAACTCATLLCSSTAAAEERLRMAALDLKASNVAATLAENLTGVVVAELTKIQLLELITRAEIDQMMSFEEEKQKLGCDDASCLAEIGGALGVAYLLTGSVGKVGEKFLINLQLIDIKQASVANRVQHEADTEQALLSGTALAARQLIAPVLAQKSGVLMVNSREEGANLFVDDALKGVTPVGPIGLPAGPHRVRMVKTGFVDWAQVVEIAPDRTEVVQVTMMPSQEFIAEYEARNGSLRSWAWVTTSAAVAFGAAALGLFLYADQSYYPDKVDPFHSKCVERDPACDAAMRDKAEANGRTYDRMIYTTYGLEAGMVAAAGVALYCWLAGDDPTRYHHFRAVPAGEGAAAPVGVTLSPTRRGGLLRAGFRF